MGICERCERSLVVRGKARERGANSPDWPARKYHLKCWKQIEKLGERPCSDCGIWKVRSQFTEIDDICCNKCKLNH